MHKHFDAFSLVRQGRGRRGLQLGGSQLEEAQDLWDYSSSKPTHEIDSETSINTLVSMGNNVNMESIPYGTFKGGAIPRTYKTLSVNQNSEPTTAPIVQDVSPLEFAGAMEVQHLLPEGYIAKPPGDAMSGSLTLGRLGPSYRYKTSYANKYGNPTPYSQLGSTTTVLNTVSSAQTAHKMNHEMIRNGTPMDVWYSPNNVRVNPEDLIKGGDDDEAKEQPESETIGTDDDDGVAQVLFEGDTDPALATSMHDEEKTSVPSTTQSSSSSSSSSLPPSTPPFKPFQIKGPKPPVGERIPDTPTVPIKRKLKPKLSVTFDPDVLAKFNAKINGVTTMDELVQDTVRHYPDYVGHEDKVKLVIYQTGKKALGDLKDPKDDDDLYFEKVGSPIKKKRVEKVHEIVEKRRRSERLKRKKKTKVFKTTRVR
jgi:hypothetical protein